MKKLTPKQQRFVDEYLIDLNATQAAIRSGYSAKTAEWIGPQLLGKTHVTAAIAEKIKKREERTEITQDMVLQRWWALANADVNEIVEYRRVNCRHCHGEDHAYQWKDEAEYVRAVAETDEDSEPPSCAGGFGFNASKEPHSDCPKCNGEGCGEQFVNDTRKLKGPAKTLYDGVKITKDGLEIKTLDRQKALDNVARHLGMFNDKLELNVTGSLADRLARARLRNG